MTTATLEGKEAAVRVSREVAPPQATDVELVEAFLNYLKFERHFSGHTAKCYAADLEQFMGYLRERQARISLRAVTPAIVAAYVTYLGTLKVRGRGKSQTYSKSTLARKFATLRSLYKFLVKREHVKASPLAQIRTPKQEKRIPKTIEPEQFALLVSTPDTTTILGARDRAMLEVLYSAGLRVSELVSLNFGHIDLTAQLIRVPGKGKKARVTPLSDAAVGAIQAYGRLRFGDTPLTQHAGEAAFLNKHGQRIDPRSVRRKLDKYLAAAGLDPTISPHTLRHTFAVQQLQEGVQLTAVQELLGHQAASTTACYVPLAGGPKGSSGQSPMASAVFADAT